MSRITLITAFLIQSILPACVQKAYDKVIILTLQVEGKKDIQSVGIRGENGPLSWDEDYPMKEVVKDSLYTATINYRTAYTQGEIKFTVNGEFELKNKPNRILRFEKDTTYWEGRYDSE